MSAIIDVAPKTAHVFSWIAVSIDIRITTLLYYHTIISKFVNLIAS